MRSTEFIENTADSGGAMAIVNGGGLGIDAGYFHSGLTSEDRLSEFLNNTATDGGALFLTGTRKHFLLDTIIYHRCCFQVQYISRKGALSKMQPNEMAGQCVLFILYQEARLLSAHVHFEVTTLKEVVLILEVAPLR